MSACWASDPRRSLGARVLVSTLAIALAGVSLASARDSVRVGKQISVGPHGVEVQDASRSASAGTTPRLAIDLGDSSHSNRRVVMIGPRIVVDEGGEVVRVFSDVDIPADQRVDGDVVTIFGSSRIEGHVTGNAVAVFGSVTLGPEAVVDGDMVAVFGAIQRDEKSTVGGESVDISVLPPIPGLSALPTILLVAGLLWVLSLFGGWIVSLVMPERLLRITATASRRTFGSVLLGLASLPLVITAATLLCITVIGIPLAFLLPFLFVLVVWIGQYAGVYGLGLKLLRRRLGEGPMIVALAVGTMFVSLFFVGGALLAGPPGITRSFALFLVSVGGLFGLALTTIGTGAVLLSRFGSTPKDVALRAETLSAPVPAPVSQPPIGV